MDAGIAALLGAALGSFTTLGAAVLNGRAQARTQSAQWHRQQRRDAYAVYLGALHDRDIALDAVLEALRAERPDLAEVDERVRRFIGLAREVHRATEIVIIEGRRRWRRRPSASSTRRSGCRRSCGEWWRTRARETPPARPGGGRRGGA